MFPAVGPFDPLDGLSREELRQRLQSLQALLAQAPVPIAIAHDPECRFISANHALSALLGVPDESNVSLTPASAEQPHYRIQRNGRDHSARRAADAVRHRTPYVREQRDRDRPRRRHASSTCRTTCEPLFDTHGEIYGCVSVCVDLTERKLAESALRDADRRKDEFLATLSHELRNPLAPIRTALEVMRIARRRRGRARKSAGDDGAAGPAPGADHRRSARRVAHHAEQGGAEARAHRSALGAAQRRRRDVRPLIDAQGQSLTLELPRQPLWADADSTRLSQVFANLLNNATKYTDRGGQIRVTARGGRASAPS